MFSEALKSIGEKRGTDPLQCHGLCAFLEVQRVKSRGGGGEGKIKAGFSEEPT